MLLCFCLLVPTAMGFVGQTNVPLKGRNSLSMGNVVDDFFGKPSDNIVDKALGKIPGGVDVTAHYLNNEAPQRWVPGEAREGFRSGFISIVGSPNVGKSTLLNRLVGQKISIVTSKSQTTRHRILGVVTHEDAQIIYQDTPGAMIPNYRLQEGMMNFVRGAIKECDALLLMTDIFEKEFPVDILLDRVKRAKVPLIIAINKIDMLETGKMSAETLEEVGNLESIVTRWQESFPAAKIIPISAMEGLETDELVVALKQHLPEGPPLYPEETLTDRSERFIVGEMIREKVFTSYGQEIPYSTEVSVTSFKEEENLTRIEAYIICTRNSQKGMIIGKGGQKIKEVGTEARKALEEFLDRRVYLELRVKVDKDWRKNDASLSRYGYL
mmetsp:Transcript_31568/g.46228  ORF Transcript_31568/g.46228 Transcript_31568/m.46228 type:complete len:383 (-) Transcript_31568:77-1225(-)